MNNKVFQGIIQRATETRNIDFKAPIKWDRNDRCTQFEILKDIAAMANSGGGHIIIGRYEPDFRKGSLSDEQLASFDITEVNKLVANFLAPTSECVIEEEEWQGDRLVVIEIPEFATSPLIFQKTGNCEHHKNAHFRDADVWIRTAAAQSVRLMRPDDMRDLLNLAVRKTGDVLLSQIERLLMSRPAFKEPLLISDFDTEYDEDNQAFFLPMFYPWVSTVSHIDLTIRPTIYLSNRLTREETRSKIRFLRATYFNKSNLPDSIPFDPDNATLEQFTSGADLIYAHPKWARYEAARFRTSGLYRFVRILSDNYDREGRIDDKERLFSPVRFIEDVTLAHLLARNVARAIMPSEEDEVEIDLRLDGLLGREPISDNAALNPTYFIGAQKGKEQRFVYQIRLTLGQLENRVVDIARERLEDVFWSFGLGNQLIPQVQRRLLGNRESRAFP